VKYLWESMETAPKSGMWVMGQRRWADHWTGKMRYQTAKMYWSQEDAAWLRGSIERGFERWSPDRWRRL
jgi:hypothetical protein